MNQETPATTDGERELTVHDYRDDVWAETGYAPRDTEPSLRYGVVRPVRVTSDAAPQRHPDAVAASEADERARRAEVVTDIAGPAGARAVLASLQERKQDAHH